MNISCIRHSLLDGCSVASARSFARQRKMFCRCRRCHLLLPFIFINTNKSVYTKRIVVVVAVATAVVIVIVVVLTEHRAAISEMLKRIFFNHMEKTKQFWMQCNDFFCCVFICCGVSVEMDTYTNTHEFEIHNDSQWIWDWVLNKCSMGSHTA